MTGDSSSPSSSAACAGVLVGDPVRAGRRSPRSTPRAACSAPPGPRRTRPAPCRRRRSRRRGRRRARCPARRRRPRAPRRARRLSGTTKVHGCLLLAEPASRPASRIRVDDVVGSGSALVAPLVAPAGDREEGVHASSVMRRMTEQAKVSLLRWLRRQLRQPTPQREHLEAAVAHDDPAEARRLLATVRLHRRAAPPRRRADRRVGAEQCPTAENEAVVRRIFDAFARKQGFALRGLFAADAVWTVPGRGIMAGVYPGGRRSSASSPACRRRRTARTARGSSTCSRARSARPRSTARPASAAGGASTSTRCCSSACGTGSSSEVLALPSRPGRVRRVLARVTSHGVP